MKPVLSSDEKHHLHHTIYSPDAETKATLVIMHGMCEHSGRYDAFASYLQSLGIAVLTYDHLGHGKTVHNANELGHWDAGAIDYLEKDALLMADVLHTAHPNVKHFIMGHSMGSFVVRNMLTQNSEKFAGAIIMGTSHRDYLIKSLIMLFGLLHHIAPQSRAVWAANLSGRVLSRKLKEKATHGNKSWLSANIDNINHFRNDPLCNFVFTNNAYHVLFSIMDKAVNQPWYQLINRNFPMLLVSGQDDPLGNMGKGIDALVSQLYQEKFNAIEKILYPNMRHEPLNETDNQIVFESIYQWISKQAETA